MSFLPSKLMEKISPNPEVFSSNTCFKAFHKHGNAKTGNDLGNDLQPIT